MATVTDGLPEALEGFRGDVLRADDDGYDEARRIHNGLIDRRPAAVARCCGTADVVAAVQLARDRELEISVRGGGHNVSGRAITDGGLMIDLSAMRGVHVDPVARIARVQGGARWADLNRESQLHSLAVTGGAISTTGVGGLTLGGGLGWLMSEYGLAADNLVSAEVVTADGRVLTASESEHPDLYWALRGGGGNFGVVPWFTFRLHEVGPMITGGLVVHPFDAARDLLRFYRDFVADVSDQLTVFAGLVHTPDGAGVKLSALIVCHTGPPERADEEVKPLLEFGSPLDVQVGPMPYEVFGALLDDGWPEGSLNYWKSSFLSELSDELIDSVVEQFEACPTPLGAIAFELFHGEVTRIPVSATAVPHREPGFNLLIPTAWLDPETTAANVAWTRETYARAEPHFAGRRWLNYLGDDEDEQAVRAAYGPNYGRLVEVKRAYDPENVFHLNQNIKP